MKVKVGFWFLLALLVCGPTVAGTGTTLDPCRDATISCVANNCPYAGQSVEIITDPHLGFWGGCAPSRACLCHCPRVSP